MTNNEYRAVDAVSRSDLFLMAKTPLHYKYNKEHQEEDATPSLIFGSAQHKMVLEPDEFDNEYAVLPSGIDRRTKDGKAAYMTFMEKAAGRTVITEEQYLQILEMLAALKRNPVACELLRGEHEASFFWKDQETGIMCKIRPDVITSYDGKPYLVDYKTTDSCADGHFEASCRRYGYKLQAGMYTEGMFQTMLQEYGFAFIAQEKTAPYAVRVYICDQDFINEGHDMFRTYMGTLKYCDETGDWYGYEGPGHEVSVLGGDSDD